MRLAGVRLPDGRALWLDAGQHVLVPLDDVSGKTLEGAVRGTVFVTPDQLLQPPAQVDGTITDVERRQQADPECDDLPGADLPPLGTEFEAQGVGGTVVGIDPVARSVTVRNDLQDRKVPL